MEKSIETIWKEGFIDEDTLIAPKIIDKASIKPAAMMIAFLLIENII